MHTWNLYGYWMGPKPLFDDACFQNNNSQDSMSWFLTLSTCRPVCLLCRLSTNPSAEHNKTHFHRNNTLCIMTFNKITNLGTNQVLDCCVDFVILLQAIKLKMKIVNKKNKRIHILFESFTLQEKWSKWTCTWYIMKSKQMKERVRLVRSN